MFKIDQKTKQIMLTRGDSCIIEIKAIDKNNNRYKFAVNDVIRLNVYKKKDYNDLKLQKDVIVREESNYVDMLLTSELTKIDDIINKPVDYWYEIVLNPETNPQTIIGYDENGSKIFTLYPEGFEGGND